ncbi:MAG: MarR family transcriptional regulator [Hoeflea sp. BRH_c9]|nr:MAG: MarR family transcriptional regulator [Hoeflea sp. BRH_c9]
MTEPKPQTIATWIALANANRVVLEGIEDALKAAGLPRLDWYDALLEIEKAGAAGIRPFDLKERLLLPQYGMSRLLDRMAKAGLVDRQGVENDGRGQIVSLTPEGRSVRRAMWPVYAERLTRSVEGSISQEEASDLARLLNKLAHPES